MKLFDVYPLFDIEPFGAQGLWLWDKAGTRYLDLYGGHAVISIGHSHPHYVKQLTGQAARIGFYSNSVKISLQEELAEKLGELSGYSGYSLFLCNSGAEANENALKLASFHNGRKKIIAFSGAFHGRTSLAVAATDDSAISAPVNGTGNVLFLSFNDGQALEAHMDESVCAVIVEGIQGVAGVRVASEGFLKTIRSVCDQWGAMMILDEVQSGYGRSGRFFAHQYAGAQPDLITVAKGMGNGFPVGGVLISPRFQARQGMLGTTFGGNHLACAAGIAVLDVIREEGLVQRALETGSYIMDQVKRLEGVREVRGRGLMIGIELEFACAALRKRLLFEERIFTGSASDKNTIRILPALNIKREEADIFLHALNKVLKSQKQTA
ncbi:MAG: aminotransferase class III-fold pyridoxal phosphate-dependent enzyme [Bacteroidota bacterium]